MKSLLAITCHNIHFAQKALARIKDLPPVSVIPIDHRIPEPTKEPHVLLVPTVACLTRNARVLNECPNIVVIVFDAPVLCKEVNATLLDVEKQTLDFTFKFKLLEDRDVYGPVRAALNSKDAVKISKKTIDMGSRLLKRVYGSVIGKYMTFVYKVPDTDRRAEIQKLVFDGWWEGNIDALVEQLSSRYPKNAAAKEFCEALKSDVGTAFANAIAKLRALKEAGKAVSYAKLSKEFGVSTFDLRYFSRGRK